MLRRIAQQVIAGYDVPGSSTDESEFSVRALLDRVADPLRGVQAVLADVAEERDLKRLSDRGSRLERRDVAVEAVGQGAARKARIILPVQLQHSVTHREDVRGVLENSALDLLRPGESGATRPAFDVGV